MPKILLINGFSFFFYSNEGSERIHIHISKADAIAKFWLEPQIELDYFEDFSPAQLRFISETLSEKRDFIIEKWYEYFSRNTDKS